MKGTPFMLVVIGLVSLVLGANLLLTGSVILGIISLANSLLAAQILHTIADEDEDDDFTDKP